MLATKVGTADKPERLYSDGPLPQAEHRGCACSACLWRRRSTCRSSHPISGRRRPLRTVRLITQVLSFYLFCRHVLEEEEARAPSPKDSRAGGGTKPAAARIGEAGMSAFLVNHSVPTQKAVDLVQRIYGPPGLSSSDQVSATRHIRVQRRPVGAALQLQQRADAPKSADATRQPNGVRHSTAMLSVASGEGRDRRAEPHDGRRSRHDRGAQAAAVPRRALRFEPQELSSLAPPQHSYKRAARAGARARSPQHVSQQ